jgi:hypothetical protein
MELKPKASLWSIVILSMVLLSLPFVIFRQTKDTAKATDSEASVQPGKTAAPSSVLVELFTSEGCSTCPPADKLLTELDENQPVNGAQVIALSEHVDYWNRLGWKDPFSSAQFTERQTDYSRTLGVEDIYTPQMIVDGRNQFVGNQRATALEAIAKAAQSPKATIEAAVKTSTPTSITLSIQVGDVPDVSHGDRADVLLAITESGLMSKVARGENAGRQLTHSAVTRRLVKIGTVEGRTLNADPVAHLEAVWKRARLRAVVFVQERGSRRILGAKAIPLTETSSQ